MSIDPLTPQANEKDRSEGNYVVVARRYRPQTFDELVGQNQVCQALIGAIETNRVGHAYLFTGVRGVGKTSAARIFAKALNCEKGTATTPCNQCDICQCIASGEDIDVLEIDGASNRGIDEIRQLRSNVSIRPSRSRFKIYIIDEVHMLTTPAFNALLKTLEEPPEHVKFIFCTTDPEKIPITVLSRCQRFDFPPIQTESILNRLQLIVDSEGVTCQPKAIQLLARRACGSMRDSQSLLEQLISFCGDSITVADVHKMLGTTNSSQLQSLTQQLIARNSAAALSELDAVLSEGTDIGQLTEQLLGHFRDVMVVSTGCSAELLLHTAADNMPELISAGQELGIETVLAIVQILDQTVTQLRYNAQGRTLLEIAFIRICKLEDLDRISTIISDLQQGTIATNRSNPPHQVQQQTAASPAVPATSKTGQQQHEPSPPQSASQPVELTPENVELFWKKALDKMEGMTADFARSYDRIAISAPNRLVVRFNDEYNMEACKRPDRKKQLEQALEKQIGRRVQLDFELLATHSTIKQPAKPKNSTRKQMREKENHPFVHKVMEMFDGEISGLDHPPSENRPTQDSLVDPK